MATASFSELAGGSWTGEESASSEMQRHGMGMEKRMLTKIRNEKF